MRLAARLVFALLLTSCGARTSLGDEQRGEGGDAGGAPQPSPLAGSRIVTIDFETFQGRGRIDGFDDMTGAGFVSDLRDGTLRHACAPVFDAAGRLLFADNGDDGPRVVRLDLETGDTESFGEWGNGVGQFESTVAVALDARGRIHVSDVALNRIVRVDDMSGAGWIALGGPGAGGGVLELAEPRGIAIMADGTILIADSANERVVAVDDMSGAGWTTLVVPPAAGATESTPWGMALDAQQRIHVVDFQGSVLHRFDRLDGSGLVSFSRGFETSQMSHVLVGPDGRIYLGMSNGAQQVSVMDDMQGTGFAAFAGPADQPFINPCGIAVR